MDGTYLYYGHTRLMWPRPHKIEGLQDLKILSKGVHYSTTRTISNS